MKNKSGTYKNHTECMYERYKFTQSKNYIQKVVGHWMNITG